MSRFALQATPIDAAAEQARLGDDAAGACVVFEGRVRDHNDGRRVRKLQYQAYEALALAEGEAIVAEAIARHAVIAARCVHRVGTLEIGDVAVWVGVSAAHRGEAFDCCRRIIDEVKRRVPIWKNEHYADGESGWLHP